MVDVLTEGARTGEYIVSEASGSRSREAVIIGAGADLAPGTVLGKVTTSGKFVALAPAATDGSQNAAAVLYGWARAAAADARATVHARDCEVNGLLLTWPTGITGPQKVTATASLASVGTIVRT